MRWTGRDRSGFTMVEVLITAAISTAVFTMLFAAFFTGGGAANRGVEILDLVTNVGLLAQHLKRDLRACYGAPGEMDIQSMVFTPDYQSYSYHFLRLENMDPGSRELSLIPVSYSYECSFKEKTSRVVRESLGHRYSVRFLKPLTIFRIRNSGSLASVDMKFANARKDKSDFSFCTRILYMPPTSFFFTPPDAGIVSVPPVPPRPLDNGKEPWMVGGGGLPLSLENLFPEQAYARLAPGARTPGETGESVLEKIDETRPEGMDPRLLEAIKAKLKAGSPK